MNIVKLNNEVGYLSKEVIYSEESGFETTENYIFKNSRGENKRVIPADSIVIPECEEIITFLKKCFTWGEIIETYSISERYLIFKFKSKFEEGEAEFAPYYNYESVGEFHQTLENALISLICRKQQKEEYQEVIFKALDLQ